MKHRLLFLITALTFTLSSAAEAGITVSPYVSIKSTKSVKPQKKDKTTETETVKQRQEAGIRGSISFWSLFSLTAGVGQSKLTTTEKVQDAKDEYGEIDYEKDLNMSTENPEQNLKITETQRNAKLTVAIDPGFWIFILRAKAGVTAQQRILETEQDGLEPTTLTFGPTYKPHSGFGLGVRFSRSMYAMAEYTFNHYKFPEIEPFEREATISFSISL
jgi:hypothetical protein